MKGIYLGAFKAYHDGFDIVYQDINGKRDLPGDMMDVDLAAYDFIIATPPCNYYSKARGNRCSEYSLKTKHLLPGDIEQRYDFTQHGWVIKYDDMNSKDHQGGYNVHKVIDIFLNIIKDL